MTAITARVTITVRVVLIFWTGCLLAFLGGLRRLGAGEDLLTEGEDGDKARDLIDLHAVGHHAAVTECRVKDLLRENLMKIMVGGTKIKLCATFSSSWYPESSRLSLLLSRRFFGRMELMASSVSSEEICRFLLTDDGWF